ncbi:MAG: hypothetical protein QOK10_1109 [Pseudonocardiales bacterium]|jgi:hypothetical protein|nr:hypothetical protein [Pseudonocardiales bacterium]
MRLQNRIHRPTVRRRTTALRDRQNLRRDLATYVTHAERTELAAILERSEPQAADYVREVMRDFPIV